jgi:plastocyanin
MRRIPISIAVLLSLFGAALLVPGAASAGGGCHGGRPVTDERTTTVAMSGNCFVATITRVDEGATVTFVNEDEASHAVTGANYSWGMLSVSKGDEDPEPYLFKGDTFTQTFDESGVYPYFCILHPSMVGAVVVGNGESSVAGESAISQLASVGARSDRGESAPSSASLADDDSPVRASTLGVIGAGVALLFGLIVLAKTLAARRASGV